MARARKTETRGLNPRLQHEMDEFQRDTAEAFKARMAEVGLSQIRLAELMGVSRAQISQLLSGKANMTLRTVAELAYYLGDRPEVGIRRRATGLWGNIPPGEVNAMSNVAPQNSAGVTWTPSFVSVSDENGQVIASGGVVPPLLPPPPTGPADDELPPFDVEPF